MKVKPMQQLKSSTPLYWLFQERLQTSPENIAEFCQRWHIIEFALFGSVLRDDFRSDSDIDVLVVYDPSYRLRLSDLLDIQQELEAKFRREVDVTNKQRLVNPFSRAEILQQYQVIYPLDQAEPFQIVPANPQMQDNVRNSAALWDMLQAIQRIQTYTQGLDEAAYLDNILIQQGVERNLEIIGEAARRLSDTFRSNHPDIDWRGVIGLRNIVAHQYDQVDHVEIWNIITTTLLRLQAQLRPLLPPRPD
jgi:uncharacterized protein with HEPN domain/predicted nucleotidyltransferase